MLNYNPFCGDHGIRTFPFLRYLYQVFQWLRLHLPRFYHTFIKTFVYRLQSREVDALFSFFN